MKNNPTPRVLLPQINWNTLHFYQKADTLYQLTAVFCHRFLPPYGDRTVDQMVQAARSGKQNIVEGFACSAWYSVLGGVVDIVVIVVIVVIVTIETIIAITTITTIKTITTIINYNKL